jgi:S1-C subfamily serine protease
MKGADRLAFCGALLMLVASASSAYLTSDRMIGRGRALSEMIPPSMVPTADLPQVDITTEKIPNGFTERGTSFYLGNDLWMSARHVLNDECAHIIMIVDGKNVAAQLKYTDDDADLAVVQAKVPEVPALPLETADPAGDDAAYAFGFPQGILGGTAGSYLGRTRLKLGGFLSGSAAVLAWSENSRYPNELDSIAGISGGPVIDEKGNVVGVIVAASVRRGRDYTVAPEIMLSAKRRFGDAQGPEPVPVRDLVTPPVALSKSADAMKKSNRIVETYCIPG